MDSGSRRVNGARRAPQTGASTMPEKILVVDVGGTHVKVHLTSHRGGWKIPSGKTMTASKMVKAVKRAVVGEQHDAVSIGYPGVVVHGRPAGEPFNLGGGWSKFDFEAAFGTPTRVLNDAAMQALGSYEGGRLLFLGLGTGLGSAMIVDGRVESMELAHLPYQKGKTYEDFAGKRGRKKLGHKKWRRVVAKMIARLRAALEPDQVVVGGGNAKHLGKLPKGVRLGSNASAFLGGVRLWRHELNASNPPRRPATPGGSMPARRSRAAAGPTPAPVLPPIRAT